MFFFCWYFDCLCKFKISNGSWRIDKTSFFYILPVFLAVKWRIRDRNRQMHVKWLQNTSVSSWIENIEAKNFIRFQLLKFMIQLAWVANFMVIFSASYTEVEVRSRSRKWGGGGGDGSSGNNAIKESQDYVKIRGFYRPSRTRPILTQGIQICSQKWSQVNVLIGYSYISQVKIPYFFHLTPPLFLLLRIMIWEKIKRQMIFENERIVTFYQGLNKKKQ